MDLAVPCGKLIDWLLARRLIPLDYTKLLSAVQARVTEAQKEQAGEALQAISEHKARGRLESSPKLQKKTLKQWHRALLERRCITWLPRRSMR